MSDSQVRKPLILVKPTSEIERTTQEGASGAATDVTSTSAVEAATAASAVAATGAALASALVLTPAVGLPLFGAKLLYDAIRKGRDDRAEDSPASEPDANEHREHEAALAEHAMMIGSALERSEEVLVVTLASMPDGLNFPPGHPLPARYYRRHPLNEDTYIPIEMYDRLLLEEREAELIRLLVDLGATGIEISKAGNNSRSLSGGAKAEASGVSGAEIAAGGESTRAARDLRVFELRGIPWTAEMQFDPTAYKWLEYEPAWKAVMHARRVGACVTASIELHQETSFSLAASAKATGILADVGLASGGANAEYDSRQETAVRFRVSFTPAET